ncbi:hypothetical protein NQ314_020588 [Rhamnusium bicolor]|uniref:GPI ethanolamine phosphate transferase 3, catalytic subunit n=1 Tax=Rhamnusium bicolor TaxID=1586634 RepID=A0AAV8WJS2_9CUCU|nr:hypothetical protein NQ314_020588 [Rhamnusium bicolor]
MGKDKSNATCLSHNEVPCTFTQSLHLNITKGHEEQCSQHEKILSILNEYNSASGICLPPRARIVLLIVDALRHDFTVYDEKIENPLPFQNKLPVIHRLIQSYPDSTRLYKFIADPPTTTMQRVKGLTTGSLPTFIDAGSNFATSEINEDNIVDQLIRNNYNVVFMGDDTWNGLYPNRFIRNYPYPSFNVWDLDTVDNGVRDHLFSELNNTDWSLLIGHFLGVDHCGHRYGPNHPEMERKLGEINLVIENVVHQIDENTMLFVIGDHGMTATGDHGGESKDEVTAGLFVYSKQPLLNLGEEKDSVKQVDLVPTLSTILGVPVPFQNLGILIINCLPITNKTLDIENWRLVLYSLWANVQQVSDYIKDYSQTTDTFNEESLKPFSQKFSILNGKIHLVETEEQFLETSKELMEFLSTLRKMCEDVWIQFDSEEQQWCFASPHEVSNISAKIETTKLQWVITVICLAAFVFATKEWLRNCGNLNGYSLTVTLTKFMPTAIVVCIAGFWVLKRVPPNKKQLNPLKSVNVLAWAVYVLTSLGRDSVSIQSEENIIPKLFKKIKTSFIEKEKSAEDIPVVCGLGTVYSSVFVIMGIYLTLLFGLLLGDAVAPSAVIMFMTAAFILIITSVLRIEKATSIGHQPTFPNISWEAAFVGTTGVFTNNFIPGTLIIINTFCSYILMGILLPLVLITPFTVFVMIPSVVGKKTDLQLASARGEVLLFERDDLMLTSMFTLSCKYIMGHGIRVFASMLAATIHCRHLMVWNIFAPKLIFESVGMLVTLVSVVIGYLILVRINRKVESLIITLNKMS